MEPTAKDNTTPQSDDNSNENTTPEADAGSVPGMKATSDAMENMNTTEPAVESMPKGGKSELKPMMMDKEKMMGKHNEGEKKHSHKKTYIIIAIIFLALGMVIGYVAYDLDIRAYYDQYYKNRQETQNQDNETSMINDEEDPENPDNMVAEGMKYSYSDEIDFSFNYPEGYQIVTEPAEVATDSFDVGLSTELDIEDEYVVSLRLKTSMEEVVANNIEDTEYAAPAAAGAVISANECYMLADPVLELVAGKEVYKMTYTGLCELAEFEEQLDKTGYAFEIGDYYVLVSGDTTNVEAMQLAVETLELDSMAEEAEVEVTPAVSATTTP